MQFPDINLCLLSPWFTIKHKNGHHFLQAVAITDLMPLAIIRDYADLTFCGTATITTFVTVKKANGGYVSSWIHENRRIGSAVTVGGPCAGLNCNPIRDSKHIIALAGGIGITPMRSMAKALIEGAIDCKITLFCGANTEVAYAAEWKSLEAAAGGKRCYRHRQ